MRSHSEIARRARILSYKLFGFPQSIPKNQDRNSGDWSKIQRTGETNSTNRLK